KNQARLPPNVCPVTSTPSLPRFSNGPPDAGLALSIVPLTEIFIFAVGEEAVIVTEQVVAIPAPEVVLAPVVSTCDTTLGVGPAAPLVAAVIRPFALTVILAEVKDPTLLLTVFKVAT